MSTDSRYVGPAAAVPSGASVAMSATSSLNAALTLRTCDLRLSVLCAPCDATLAARLAPVVRTDPVSPPGTDVRRLGAPSGGLALPPPTAAPSRPRCTPRRLPAAVSATPAPAGPPASATASAAATSTCCATCVTAADAPFELPLNAAAHRKRPSTSQHKLMGSTSTFTSVGATAPAPPCSPRAMGSAGPPARGVGRGVDAAVRHTLTRNTGVLRVRDTNDRRGVSVCCTKLRSNNGGGSRLVAPSPAAPPSPAARPGSAPACEDLNACSTSSAVRKLVSTLVETTDCTTTTSASCTRSSRKSAQGTVRRVHGRKEERSSRRTFKSHATVSYPMSAATAWVCRASKPRAWATQAARLASVVAMAAADSILRDAHGRWRPVCRGTVAQLPT